MLELAQKIKLNFALAPDTATKYARSPATKLLYLPEKLLWNWVSVHSTQTAAGTSVQNIGHWSQEAHSRKFQAYDWGSSKENIKKYQQANPPLYNVEEMIAPTVVWTGGQDMLADPKDVSILLSQIKRLLYHRKIPEWAYLDFNCGLDAPLCVYNEIIDLLQKFLSVNHSAAGTDKELQPKTQVKQSEQSKHTASALSHSPKMWCLLVLLCSQAIGISEGFTAPYTLKLEEGLHRKQRNPEDLMNVSEMIRYHGYPCEEHEVTTKDGYMLGVFRIPSGRNMHNTGQKPAVFLQHAFLGDATHWISNLPNNSLGFLLADAGYDVWLGNSRGNTWSLKHKTLKPSQKEFWQFSFDEMGKYDIPAELYFIMNKTRQKDVFYIGHSEGTAAGFIAFSTYPELAKRVKVFFALGPVTTCTYAIGPLMKIAKLPAAVLRVCLSSPHKAQGPAYHHGSRIDVYVGHSPAGTSVQNVIHWHQVFYADRFQAYDYGSKENMKKYNQTTPPAYEIEKISIPIAIWSGGQDKFADARDTAKLLSRITNLCYHKHFPDWGHLDFIWGLDAAEKMYMKIIELLIKYL
ncbi:UNVERIFIED_CONTAM: hypothetical protein H355_014579 [Colinus virginianus]|nr:hypothetical protein H355_014579 [Colinus virginianus]